MFVFLLFALKSLDCASDLSFPCKETDWEACSLGDTSDNLNQRHTRQTQLFVSTTQHGLVCNNDHQITFTICVPEPLQACQPTMICSHTQSLHTNTSFIPSFMMCLWDDGEQSSYWKLTESSPWLRKLNGLNLTIIYPSVNRYNESILKHSMINI